MASEYVWIPPSERERDGSEVIQEPDGTLRPLTSTEHALKGHLLDVTSSTQYAKDGLWRYVHGFGFQNHIDAYLAENDMIAETPGKDSA